MKAGALFKQIVSLGCATVLFFVIWAPLGIGFGILSFVLVGIMAMTPGPGCAVCKQPLGHAHLPTCNREGIVTEASVAKQVDQEKVDRVKATQPQPGVRTGRGQVQ